jgi:hypothetical protein
VTKPDDVVEMNDRQNDIIAFSVIYAWAMMTHEHRSSFGGTMDIKSYEFEEILDRMELSSYICDAKIKLLKGEIP